MQVSKKLEQNVIFYAIILWQEDLKADKVEYAQLITFHNGNTVIF